MWIAAFFIYQVVTLSGGNISWRDGLGLCSKVWGILNCPVPSTAVPVHSEHRVASCGENTVVTAEELRRWVNYHPSQCSAGSLVVAGDCGASRRPSNAVREQFLLSLLEDCSFFSHLVLRCVRGEDGSAPGVLLQAELCHDRTPELHVLPIYARSGSCKISPPVRQKRPSRSWKHSGRRWPLATCSSPFPKEEDREHSKDPKSAL